MIKMEKKEDETMREFVTRFEKEANVASKHGIKLSNAVLGLKLIRHVHIISVL